MGQFVLDSQMIFAKTLLMTTVILIPIALAMGNNVQWESHTTSSGRSVYVKKNADDSFEDGHGNHYTERD
ncbi:MAG: hypothetical protein IKK75_00760 [Clostridia bacterium]|nr:hypothetical protein [Clostridia bacterium]